MDKTNPKVKYTIEATIEIDATMPEDFSQVAEMIEAINGFGYAEVKKVELIDG